MFDAQVVQTNRNTPRGKLLENFVTARIVQMNGIDIGLYDYDRHNAVYYFIVNAEEQIYLRYGGRDEFSPESYLDLDSLEIALKLGLEKHELYKQGKFSPPRRPERKYPSDIRALNEEVTQMRRCVECHLISDYENITKEEDGELNKLRDMFRSPDIHAIGIHLDVPKGLVVKRASGSAQKAGMQPGDLITAVNDKPVLTFGDFQYYYDKTPRQRKSVSVSVKRVDGSHDLNITLPKEWWWTDLYFRFWTVEPVLFMFTERLPNAEKERYDLPIDGFAVRVTEVDPAAQVYNLHELKVGDIIYEVAGIRSDPRTQYADRHIQLSKTAGDSVAIKIIRDNRIVNMKIWSHRQSFRKPAR